MSKEILNISSSPACPGKGIVYDTQEKMHDIMSTPILYQELLFADRNTNVHCIGGGGSLSIDRIAWKGIDAYDPSKKYVEHILFRPDNEEGKILRRQKIIQELLPTDFGNTKELLTQWVHSFSRLEYFQSQYYDIDLDDEEKKEVLDEACQILESLFNNTQVAIAEIRTKENISLGEIIEDFSRHFERVFPEQNIILHADEPQKLFEYIPKLKGLYEAIIRFRALLTVLAYTRASHMNPVEFAEESVGYTNARSIFLDEEKNVPALSFPDIPLILLRAPNGSGKSFAQERDMAIQILGQSIGFVPADHPRLRIYDTIWMQSRLQSVQHTSSDLSALGVEGQSLDTLYNTIVEAPGKKVLLYLDETGATTDEKSEHTIMRCFIDSIRRISPEGRIRFSTHNQPFIDAMRGRKDSNIGFYTFTHEHKLEVGERNSDTIRSMKHLFERINTTIYEYCKSGQYSLFSDEIEDFLKRLIGGEFSSKYKKQELMKVWEEFSQFTQGILEELECYERGEMTELGRGILHTQKNSHPIHFSREQQALLASRSKGIGDKVFSPTNGRSDYQISSVHHPMWKTPRKTMIGRKGRIHDHFYEDSNYPIDSRSEDHFLEARIGKEPEYDGTDIGYTNTGGDVSEARSHIRLPDVKKNPSRREEMFHQIYSRVSTLNIPLTQEKGSMLAELQNRRDAVDKLISHGDNLCDIIRVFIVMRAELAKDFRDKQFMGEGGFLGRLHASLTYTDPESYRNKTDCMELLEHENDFEHLYDYRVHQLLYWYELIRTLYLLAHGEKDFLGELDRYVQEYNEMFLGKNFSDKTVHLNKAIKQSLIDLLKNHIPRLLEEGGDETLGEILGRDYYDCLIECKDLKRDQEQFWSFALRFIAKHQNDTTNYLTEFLSLLESFKSPLLQGIAKYYNDILRFLFGAVENIPSLIQYHTRYTTELGPKGFLPFSTLRETEKTDEYYLQERLMYEEDTKVPNMTGDLRFWHLNMWAIIHDIEEFLGVLNFSTFLKEKDFCPVNFHEGKGLEIDKMKNPHIEDRVLIPNSVSLTPEYPIEIIEGYNSSGKTQYIRDILKTINQALNIGHVNAETMRIGNISEYAYMDRIVTNDSKLSSGQRDILSWTILLKLVEDKDFVIVEADEIFTTMDSYYTTLFAQVFIGRLRSMGKYAIIVTHNHDFAKTFGHLPGVQVNHFHSEVGTDGTVHHTYIKQPGGIDDSKGPEVLKSLGIGKGWL